MFQKLVSHNPDLRRLVDRGYAVGFDEGYLIVRDIPYLDANRALQWGAIVAKLKFVDPDHVIQEDHQVFFAGAIPHEIDGTPIKNLAGGPTSIPLDAINADVVVQRSFSNKPSVTGCFEDFFAKIESYVAILSGPAIQLHSANPYTFRTKEAVPDSVFKVHDTLTSRAELGDLAGKFRDDVVAIIGLGGTGAYILDFLTRTPVREIRAFDPDLFHVHNAFRSPGRLEHAEFNTPKATIYQARYENFRHGFSATQKYIDASCADDLAGVTFAFVCVDKGTARAGIFDLLLEQGIPFIDVGMGLRRRGGALDGMIRATYYSREEGQARREKGLAPFSDDPDDDYRVTIQIGELNALNACLAVIKYKKLRGFYHDEEQHFYHSLTSLSDCFGEPVS
jgi:hypothetical protein